MQPFTGGMDCQYNDLLLESDLRGSVTCVLGGNLAVYEQYADQPKKKFGGKVRRSVCLRFWNSGTSSGLR